MKNSENSKTDDSTDVINTDDFVDAINQLTARTGVSRDHDLFRKVHDISYDLVPRIEAPSVTNIRDNTYGFCLQFYRDCGDNVADLPFGVKVLGNGRHNSVPGFEDTDYSTPQAAMDAGVNYANDQIKKYGYGWTCDVQKNGFLDIYDSSGKLLFNLSLTMEPKLREEKGDADDAGDRFDDGFDDGFGAALNNLVPVSDEYLLR